MRTPAKDTMVVRSHLRSNQLGRVAKGLRFFEGRVLQMGDFTRLQFELSIKKDAPEDIVSIIRYMMGEPIENIVMILSRTDNHRLFTTSRRETMLRSFSDPADNKPDNTIHSYIIKNHQEYKLHVYSVFKAHDDEISLFFDWIHPYVNETWLTYVGTIVSDTSDHPTLIYYHPQRFGFVKVGCDEFERGHSVELEWNVNSGGLDTSNSGR